MTWDSATDQWFVANGPSGSISVLDGATRRLSTIYVTGDDPIALAADPTNHSVFVSLNNGTILVLNDSTGGILATILGPHAGAMLYDPVNGLVYAGGGRIAINATSYAVTSLSGVPESSSLALDTANDRLFLADALDGKLSVLNGSTNQAIANLTLSYVAEPYEVAYDPVGGDVYAADLQGGNVGVVSGRNDTQLTTITDGGNYAGSVAVDPVSGLVFFGSSGYHDVVGVINGSNRSYIGSFPVGLAPDGMAFDASSGEVLVAQAADNNLTVVNGTTGAKIATLPYGAQPQGVAYDPVDERIWVANGAGNNLSVLDARTGGVVGSVPMGNGSLPIAVTVDPANGQVFVADFGSSNVTIVNGSNDSPIAVLPTGAQPRGLAYDASNECVYVTSAGASTLTVINASTDREATPVQLTYVGSYGIAYNPGNRSLYVGAQSGLVVVNGSAGSVVGEIALPEYYPAVSVAVDPVNDRIFTADGSNDSGRDVAVVNGTTNTVVTAVSLPNGPWADGVSVDPQSGLAYVEARNGSEIYVVNGSGSVVGWFDVAPDTIAAAWDPSNGFLFATSSRNASISILSTLPAAYYNVTVTESGLPPGFYWWANVAGDNRSAPAGGSLEFSETAGTYALAAGGNYGWACSGIPDLNVTDSPLEVQVACSFRNGPVTVSESGLPSRTTWWANLDGTNETGPTGTPIVFTITPGVYVLTAGGPSGWSCTGITALNLTGVPTDVSVACTQTSGQSPTYPVLFVEQGLPTRDPAVVWTVLLNGVSVSSNAVQLATQLMSAEPNGSYTFAVSAPGFNATPTDGSLTVAGSGVTQDVTFTPAGTHAPLVTNITYSIQYASCLSNGGVTNFVLLGAGATGGVPPYTFWWNLSGPRRVNGSVADVTLVYGNSTFVGLNAIDSTGALATSTIEIPLELPPCPPPYVGTIPPGPPFSLTPDQWTIVGLGSALAAMSGAVVWLALRLAKRPPMPPR